MNGDIEALILSGEFFNGKERSSSPTRSNSPDDLGWHDDELELSPEEQKYRDMGYDSDTARNYAHKDQKEASTQAESIGMGPGRTGVKGVIKDRDEAVGIEREKKVKEMEDLRKKMEASNLGGKTYLEEEREKAARGIDRFDELVLKELEKEEFKRNVNVFGAPRTRFGYLREVGVKQFVKAVEQEERGVWVVVHIYDPSLDRCYYLDDLLSRLAKENPTTKFLRAKATALEFAKLKPKKNSRPINRHIRRIKEEDDDLFDDQDNESEGEETQLNDEDVDLDVLPTLLVYRDGQLVHNWVRVDWVAGDAGVDELLTNHNITAKGIFPQEEGALSRNPESDDEEFQASLDRLLRRSGETDDDLDWS